ncbi:hypothetical protein [Sphingomonas parva]|uniref:hypothetical protein n=1 Tax=Sphingomonas parva TaxID=2555898 RepID=UPI00107410B0|nr:hypothetical protein [Sphingomonas parva]
MFELDKSGRLSSLQILSKQDPRTPNAPILVAVPARLVPPEAPGKGVIGVLKTTPYDALLLIGSEDVKGTFKLASNEPVPEYAIDGIVRGTSFAFSLPSRTTVRRLLTIPFSDGSSARACSTTRLRIPPGFKVIEEGTTIEALRPIERVIPYSEAGTKALEVLLPTSNFGEFLKGSAINFVSILAAAVAGILGSGLRPKTYRNVVLGYSAACAAYLVSGLYAAMSGYFGFADELTNLATGVASLALAWVPYRLRYIGLRDPKPRPPHPQAPV